MSLTRRDSCSASMGDLCHLCGRRSADPAVLPVHLHQVLLQREEEEAAAEEGREDQPEGRERKNDYGFGEWQQPLDVTPILFYNVCNTFH